MIPVLCVEDFMDEKPCPFCGCTELGSTGSSLYCTSCMAIGPSMDLSKQHELKVKAWNQREGDNHEDTDE